MTKYICAYFPSAGTSILEGTLKRKQKQISNYKGDVENEFI